MDEGIAGDLVDTRDVLVESHVADSALPFGYGCAIGASISEVKLPDSTGDTARGVVGLKHKEHGYPYSAGDAKYAINDLVNVVRRGKVRVVCQDATAEAPAYVISTGTYAGQFTASSTNNLLCGTFRTTQTTAGGIAEVELNLP
jgi:hypothetical protein